MAELGRRAKATSRVLATASSAAKDAALSAAAGLLVQHGPAVLEATAADVARAEAAATAATVVDRLRLTPPGSRPWPTGFARLPPSPTRGRDH